MAPCSRALAIKAALLVGFVLILLNLFGSRRDSAQIGLPWMSSTQWPKRTRTSAERLDHLSARRPTPDNDSHPSPQERHHPTNDPTNPEKMDLSSSNVSDIRPKSVKPPLNESQSAGVMPAAASNASTTTNSSSTSSKNSTRLSINSESPVDGSSNVSDTTVIYSSRAGSSPEGPLARNELSSNVQTEHNAGIIDSLLRKLGQDSCPPIPPSLAYVDGPIEIDASYEPLASVEQRLGPKLQPGGQYTPSECSARDRVAIIVPYRDREQHLPVFLKNLHPFLMKQQIEYGIYIVEQAAGSQFNRASLMNVGFIEAMRDKNWDCMVFHDVDLLPMDDRNLYTCPDQPRHMSVAVDTFGFKLPYSTIFGGVSAMTAKQFRTVNGFSNSFWGWGGEDDDMSNRLKHVGFHIARYPINIARYTMLSHKKEKANPKRYEKLVTGAKRFDSDGLNSLHYQLLNLIHKPLFTWVHVEISPDSS